MKINASIDAEALAVLQRQGEQSANAVKVLSERWHRSHDSHRSESDIITTGMRLGWVQAISLITDRPYGLVLDELRAGTL